MRGLWCSFAYAWQMPELWLHQRIEKLLTGHQFIPQQESDTTFRKTKTSDFFEANIRTFDAKHPYFCPKKSDVLQIPDRCISPLRKKFLKKNLHFLHPYLKHPAFTGSFGCRIGCRIVFFGCRIVHFPYKTAQKKRQNRYGFLP